LKISSVMTATIAGLVLVPAVAFGHGSMSDPGSRVYQCAIASPDDPVCVTARAANPQALYDWMEVNIGNAAGRHRELIPDGRLCSAGRDKYAAFDRPAAWPSTTLRPGADGRYTLTWRSTAPHATEYYRVYITKASYDRSRALRWDDLELVHDSGVRPLETTTTLRMSLPQRTGPQVLYTIWQRSDSPEAFYSCADVVLDGGSATPAPQPTPTPTPVPAPTPTPAPTPAPSGLRVTGTITSDWGSGYCRDVEVMNPGASPVAWTVPVTVDGRISSLWNGRAAGGATSGTIQVAGEFWNLQVAGGGRTTFGYCANRGTGLPAPQPAPAPQPSPAPQPAPAPAPSPAPQPVPGGTTVTRTISTDWGSGFCADVTVRPASATPVTWSAQLQVNGTITSIWDAATPGSSGSVAVRGMPWNATASSGSPARFGYCAQR